MPASPVARRLGELTFVPSDPQWFATLSHDWNPMHVDPVAARRLLSGRQVVHGIHTLLAALEFWHAEPGDCRASVQCEFSNPVHVGDTAVFTRLDESTDRSVIVAEVDGLACTRVVIDAAGLPPGSGATWRPARAIAVGVVDAPLDEPPAAQVGCSYVLAPSGAEELAQRFPNAATALGSQRIAALATLSRFVGMVCPGLHSVFSSVAFALDAPTVGDELTFFVSKFDARFRLFIIAFDGCLRGELRAFVRPPPQPQPSMREVRARVAPGEFGGTRSLVIGGSRGLGETVAKILGAGGGEVIATHAAGAADAQRVADEINAGGPGRCTTLKLELTCDRFDAFGIDVASLTAVYFFATPRIFRRKTGVFDRALFDDFVAFYLERFTALCEWLQHGARERPIKVYLPSTVFISNRPKGLTEYAMAKAAAEVLAADLNRSLPNVSVVFSRLPRLATDQTASIMQLATESTLDALLPIVRELNTRAA